MTYTVVIQHCNEVARLRCSTFEEAIRVKQSFINYGKYQSVEVEISPEVDTIKQLLEKT